MALKHSYTKFQVEFPEAYSKIVSINYSSTMVPATIDDGTTSEATEVLETKNQISYTIETFSSEENRLINSGHVSIKSYLFVPDWDTEVNPLLKQCYEHAKLQPEFTGAIDV